MRCAVCLLPILLKLEMHFLYTYKILKYVVSSFLTNFSPNIVRMNKSRRLRLAGHVGRMEEGRSAFKILTGKPTGKRIFGRPRRRWEVNIRIDLGEMCFNAEKLGLFGSG